MEARTKRPQITARRSSDLKQDNLIRYAEIKMTFSFLNTTGLQQPSFFFFTKPDSKRQSNKTVKGAVKGHLDGLRMEQSISDEFLTKDCHLLTYIWNIPPDFLSCRNTLQAVGSDAVTQSSSPLDCTAALVSKS